MFDDGAFVVSAMDKGDSGQDVELNFILPFFFLKLSHHLAFLLFSPYLVIPFQYSLRVYFHLAPCLDISFLQDFNLGFFSTYHSGGSYAVLWQ